MPWCTVLAVARVRSLHRPRQPLERPNPRPQSRVLLVHLVQLPLRGSAHALQFRAQRVALGADGLYALILAHLLSGEK